MLTDNKNRFLEILYHLCFVVYTTLSIITFSPVIDKIWHIIDRRTMFTVANWGAVAVLAVIYIFKHHESKKEVALELFVAAVFTLASVTNQTVSNVFHLTQWTTFMVVGMFIICATVTTLKRISIVSLLTTLITVAAFHFASSADLIASLTKEHSGATAHYMGFLYYTHPSYYMLFAWLMYMYIRGEKKIGWIELLAEFAFLVYLHNYTTCRLASVCTFIAFAAYVVIVKLELIKLHWKFTNIVSVAGFPACAAFTFITGLLYSSENNILKIFNRALSGRLSLVNRAFDRYNISLLGRIIKPMENESYFYLDSCYAYALFGCGLVFFAVVMAMYTYMCYYACKKNDKSLLVWLATLAIFGIVGDVWVHISYTSLILGFFIFFRENNILKKPQKVSVSADSSI